MSEKPIRALGLAATILGVSGFFYLTPIVAGQAPAAGTATRTNSPTAGTASRNKTVPRTSWGDPDLQGTWDATFRNWQTAFERDDAFGGKATLTDAEVAELERQAAAQIDAPPRPGDTGNYNDFWTDLGKQTKQTSMVVDPPDGKLPPLTPEGKLARQRRTRIGYYAPEDFRLWERCITRGGMPNIMFPRGYNNNTQIVQTPGYVAMLHEMIHEVRIIPLDGRPHLPDTIRHWLGDGRGHWEGETLVVETTNLHKMVSALQPWANYTSGEGSGEKMRLVERFTRVDANTIDYMVTVDDPVIYTRPWTVRLPLAKSDELIFEYACHEGNYSVPAMFMGQAAVDAAKAKAPVPPR